MPTSSLVAILRLRDESEVSKLLTLSWVQSSQCNHDDSTICPSCLDSWSCDWDVWLPVESIGTLV